MTEEEKNTLNLVGIESLENVEGIIRYDTNEMLDLRASALKEVDLANADCVISAEE